MNESSESIESGLAGFHFAPPTMLLKPVPSTSTSCLETSSETVQEQTVTTAEVPPISPEIITTSCDLVPTISKLNLPTLSLSIPVPDEDNTEKHGFNLQKDVLDAESITSLPVPAKSVFTNVRERFQPRKLRSPEDDESDPFAFREEVYTPPLRKRKRILRSKEETGTKKTKSRDTSGINESNDDQVGRNDGASMYNSIVGKTVQQSKDECFIKIVKTCTITTTTKVIKTHIVYAKQDGTVITEETKNESSEPECEITNESETREEVDEIPSKITSSNAGNTEENLHEEIRQDNKKTEEQSFAKDSNISHMEASKSICSERTTVVQQSRQGITNTTKETTPSREHGERNSKTVAAIMELVERCESTPGRSEDVRNSEVDQLTKEKDLTRNPRLHKECDLRSSKDNDIILIDSAESSVTEPSETTRTSSPPLFAASFNSILSSSPDELAAGSVSKTEESPIKQISYRKQKTRNMKESLPKRNAKRKRPLSVDNPRTSPRSSTVSRVFHEGTRVFARWYDRHYYPGHVVSKCSNGSKYRIKFHDGNESNILEQCIIAVDYLQSDQPVMFCEKTGDEYIDGVIKGFYNNGDDRGYKVLGMDNKMVNCPHSNVLLSSEQAAIFLSLQDTMKSEHVVSSLDSSSTPSSNEPCENLTKTSQRSRASYDEKLLTFKDTNATGKVEEERKKKDTCKVLAEKDSEKKKHCKVRMNVKQVLQDKKSSRKKRKKENVAKVIPENVNLAKKARETAAVKHQNQAASETPKSSRKSTGKKSPTDKNASKDEAQVGKVRRRLSTVMQSCEKTHPVPTRSSPRKLNSRASNNKNLILPTNKDLFRGYGFILTGSDVRSISNENSDQEDEQVYIRDDVITQIRTGGGEVLDKFPEDYPRDSCFLLSNVCKTTAKYFNALVLGVPCLSHAWVRDCCLENRLISFKNYLLPAGKNLITERLVEEQNYVDALRGLKVHLVGEDEFKEQWSTVLKAAGCNIIKKLPSNILQKIEQGDEFVCDVIVIRNGHVAHSTVQKACLLNIPTVTIHWVKQCILMGVRVDFNAHHSFIYRVEGK